VPAGNARLDATAVRRRRLRAQRLTDAAAAEPAAVVRALAGVQAQDRRAACLALRARGAGPSAEAVEHALSSDRTLVRTWAMRGTLHLLAAQDLPLVLAVFGPLGLARGQRRLTQLGLPPDEAKRSTREAAEVLAREGPLTRHELAARLRERGVPVDPSGQAPIHVVGRAALAGVLCEVGVRGREELYGAIDPGPLPDRDAAVAGLARRYAAAHAPATAADFAAWSGLPSADVRAAWRAAEAAGEAAAGPGDEPATKRAGEAAAWPVDESATGRAGDATAGGDEAGVRLLGAFDEWLLGWASRDFTLPPRHARRAVTGGIVRPVAIADGRVFATWRLDRARRRIHLDAFARVTKTIRDGVEAEAHAVGAFLGGGTWSTRWRG
jgi:hypothetical protein